MGNGVCFPTAQASDSPRAATAHRLSAPPDGADTVPFAAGDGAGLAGLCRAPADPAGAQPVPRTAATAVIAAVNLNGPRIDYLKVTILNQQPLPNALLCR